MAKTKEKYSIKSYILPHFANDFKQQQLWDLYTVYSTEYSFHVKHKFNQFLNNTLPTNIGKKLAFSHLGSTKHYQTQLSSGFLQACLAQVSATLNNYLANINNKFNEILNKSTIKDLDLLHQLRSINSQHKWLFKHKFVYYYPELMPIMDDFGNTIYVKNTYKLPFPVSQEAKKLSHKIFKHIISNHYNNSGNYSKARVRFPNLDKPKLVLDSRLFEYEESEKSTLFHGWLNISTLNKRTRISIPLRTYDFFNGIKDEKSIFNGVLGGTVEILFNNYPYKKENKNIIVPRNSKRKAGYKNSTLNREIKFVFNRKSEVLLKNENLINKKEKTVGMDMGMVTLLATSEGELLGNNWLEKLSTYDKQITELGVERQKLGLKTRCKRYDNLIAKVRGFIKTSINQILNNYFKNDSLNTNIKEQIKNVIIEKLHFNNPSLSKKLNRIIKNLGLKVFHDKLKVLSKVYNFNIIEVNPAYSSQECRKCGFVDFKNRLQQKIFKCKCCGHKENADINASRVLKKRFFQDLHKTYKNIGKVKVLEDLKVRFVKQIPSLILNGQVSRRKIEILLKESSYFKDFVKTTEATGVEPIMT